MQKFVDVPVAQARADMLVLIREVAYAEGEFTLASGKKSNYYIDGRRVTIHPKGAILTGLLFLDALADLLTTGGTWGITGLSMGADPIITGTALVASLKGQILYPFYCRKEAKGHGAGRRLEGFYELVTKCAVVEDTVTSGSSALAAADAAREVGIEPAACIALVDRKEGGRETIEGAGMIFRSIFTIDDLRAG